MQLVKEIRYQHVRQSPHIDVPPQGLRWRPTYCVVALFSFGICFRQVTSGGDSLLCRYVALQVGLGVVPSVTMHKVTLRLAPALVLVIELRVHGYLSCGYGVEFLRSGFIWSLSVMVRTSVLHLGTNRTKGRVDCTKIRSLNKQYPVVQSVKLNKGAYFCGTGHVKPLNRRMKRNDASCGSLLFALRDHDSFWRVWPVGSRVARRIFGSEKVLAMSCVSDELRPSKVFWWRPLLSKEFLQGVELLVLKYILRRRWHNQY